ncbi:MAG: outer membrane protein OmpA, partial [Mucilaginibacter sp.]|nr:outer membrane protein OmpA [Mucilaginibacter sp.]
GQHSFNYRETNKPDINSDLSEVQTVMYAGQIGTGYDIILSKPAATRVFALSPFIAYLPDFGNAPRLIDNWNVNTIRAGVALKFAHKSKAKVVENTPLPPLKPVPVIPEPEIKFAVTAPKAAPVKLEILETFPLRNYIFINKESAAIPARYVKFTQNEAADFKEEKLLTLIENPGERSTKQLTVYHNILNIIGDRMRSNPESHLTLIGSSIRVNEGKAFAENVKTYLVSVFGIAGARITTQQRSKPLVPSEHMRGSKQLELIRAEDRRVDIISSSNAILTEVSSKTMKSVVQNSIEKEAAANNVVLNVNKAEDVLKTWSVDITDGKGFKQSFGPYNKSTAIIPARELIANSTDAEGNYHVVMTGQTKSGKSVKKDTTIHLLHQQLIKNKALRYSILFDFDKAHTISTYQSFLSNVVAPNIPENSTVVIHGHTDIVGSEKHNQTLSDNRAMAVQRALQSALIKAGKNNVKFDTRGFGQDVNKAAFANALPEERFYNRTVIIDIVPN